MTEQGHARLLDAERETGAGGDEDQVKGDKVAKS